MDDMERDQKWMKQALECGESALKRSEIPVGCVFVAADGTSLLAQGSNMTNATRNGTTHAEINAINEAIANGVMSSEFRDAELYVTCEPCIMCASALSRLGIKGLYMAAQMKDLVGMVQYLVFTKRPRIWQTITHIKLSQA